MEQNKKPIIIAVVVTAVVVVGLGSLGLYVKSQMGKKVVLNDGAASISGSNTTSESGIAPVGSSSNGLSVNVSGSSAQDLGQLNGSQGTGAQGGTQSNTSQSSNSGSSASQAFDPSTFSQYDKYKTDTKALFGDVQAGTGAEVTATSKVAVYYKGWLTNGTLFDQSRTGSDGNLQPFTFTMGQHQVIPGWEEGIAGMKVGGTRLLIVPPSVGYGAAGQGPIPGDSLLVFEVQLVAVQ
jgi:FKBP-type peptidyl-prolyl cis-trans isomerase